MEHLEYLIRTLTYKRSCLELQMKEIENNFEAKNMVFGQIKGLNFAIDEIYHIIQEIINDEKTIN